jgi:hypothetical protein
MVVSLHRKLEITMTTIEELQKLREREDHVEFKRAGQSITTRLPEARRPILVSAGIVY